MAVFLDIPIEHRVTINSSFGAKAIALSWSELILTMLDHSIKYRFNFELQQIADNPSTTTLIELSEKLLAESINFSITYFNNVII